MNNDSDMLERTKLRHAPLHTKTNDNQTLNYDLNSKSLSTYSKLIIPLPIKDHNLDFRAILSSAL